jgi:hypothetical protein
MKKCPQGRSPRYIIWGNLHLSLLQDVTGNGLPSTLSSLSTYYSPQGFLPFKLLKKRTISCPHPHSPAPKATIELSDYNSSTLWNETTIATQKSVS